MSEAVKLALISVLSALSGGGLASLINWLANRHKVRADTIKVIQETASDLLDDLRCENQRLGQKVETLERKLTKLSKKLDRYGQRVVYLMVGIELLMKQIKARNEEPAWTPDEWDPDRGDE